MRSSGGAGQRPVWPLRSAESRCVAEGCSGSGWGGVAAAGIRRLPVTPRCPARPHPARAPPRSAAARRRASCRGPRSSAAGRTRCPCAAPPPAPPTSPRPRTGRGPPALRPTRPLPRTEACAGDRLRPVGRTTGKQPPDLPRERVREPQILRRPPPRVPRPAPSPAPPRPPDSAPRPGRAPPPRRARPAARTGRAAG